MLENASKDLKCIMEHGFFMLIIKPKRIVYVSKMNSGDSDSKLFLHFYPKMSCALEKWNNKQIDDFVQKLGFLESQTTDDDQQVKLFQQLNQVYYILMYKCYALM